MTKYITNIPKRLYILISDDVIIAYKKHADAKRWQAPHETLVTYQLVLTGVQKTIKRKGTP